MQKKREFYKHNKFTLEYSVANLLYLTLISPEMSDFITEFSDELSDIMKIKTNSNTK